MLWRTPSARFWRNLPAGFIQPCQPTLVRVPPAGPGWLHEVKHDGFRILARKQGARVEVWSRRGAVFNDRFPRIAEAVGALPVDNALIDGEAVVFLPDGHSDFAALLTKAGGEQAYAQARKPDRPTDRQQPTLHSGSPSSAITDLRGGRDLCRWRGSGAWLPEPCGTHSGALSSQPLRNRGASL